MAALMTRLVRKLATNETGAELIEFALTLPLLLLLVVGIIEFGLVFREYEILTNAAREGARISVLPGYSATQVARRDNAVARVNQYLDAAGLDENLGTRSVSVPTPVALTPPATGTVCNVTVTVTYPHPLPFLSGIMSYFGASFGNMTLTATSTMRTEVAAGGC